MPPPKLLRAIDDDTISDMNLLMIYINRTTGHTISQRLRKLKQIPAELIPLGTWWCYAKMIYSES